MTSQFADEEARRNLEAKFSDAVKVLDRSMKSVVIVPSILQGRCPIDLSAKDVPIFLSAVGARCTHSLTGDRKYFGRFMNAPHETSGIVIQTVAEFLSSL